MNLAYYNELGEMLAREQLCLLRANKLPLAFPAGRELHAQEEGGFFTIHFDGGEASFDKQTGRMRRFAYKGKDLLNPDPASGEKGFFPNIYRAPIDNDMNIRKSWENRAITAMKPNYSPCAQRRIRWCPKVRSNQTTM